MLKVTFLILWNTYHKTESDIFLSDILESNPEAHFATFPEKLIEDCVKAGCREGGIIIDPFMGAGTTAIVARKLGRNYIGCELNEDYIEIAEKRIHDEIGLFQ